MKWKLVLCIIMIGIIPLASAGIIGDSWNFVLGIFGIEDINEMPSRIQIINQGESWTIVYSTDSDYIINVEDKNIQRTKICMWHKTATKPNDIPSQKNIYSESGKLITTLNRLKVGKDIGYCRVIDTEKYVRFGEHSTVLIYQNQSFVQFEDMNATLYKKVGDNWEITPDSIWVRADADTYKFGGDDSYGDNEVWQKYKYVVETNEPIEKHGFRYRFENHFINFIGDCFKVEYGEWKDTNGFEILNEADCKYNLSGNRLEVEFYSNGTIDPLISSAGGYPYNTTINVTEEPDANPFVHLNITNDLPYNETRLYYTYDYGDMTVYDYSGNDNDGSWPYSYSNYTSGVFNRSVYFASGAGNPGNVIFADDDNSLDFGTSENFSITTWLNEDSLITSHFLDGIVDKCSRGLGGSFSWPYGQGYSLALDSATGKVMMTIVSNTPANKYCQVSTDLVLPLDKWHHVVATVERGVPCSTNAIKIYINGTLMPTTKTAVSIFIWGVYSEGDTDMNIDNSIGLRVGAGVPGLTQWFDGEMDDTMIIGSLLSSSDVLDLYNNQSDRFLTTGEMNFENQDYDNNNTVNVSIASCQTLKDGSLNISVNDADETAFISCNATDHIFTSAGNENLSIRLKSDGFYSPVVRGNITINFFDTATILCALGVDCQVDCSTNPTVNIDDINIPNNEVYFYNTGIINLIADIYTNTIKFDKGCNITNATNIHLTKI